MCLSRCLLTEKARSAIQTDGERYKNALRRSLCRATQLRANNNEITFLDFATFVDTQREHSAIDALTHRARVYLRSQHKLDLKKHSNKIPHNRRVFQAHTYSTTANRFILRTLSLPLTFRSNTKCSLNHQS